MSYLSLSKRWAGYLTEKTGLTSEKEVILTYIIEVLVINLGNVLLTLVLGLFLGVLPGTVSCLTTVALFRHTAGGAHSKSPWRCAMVTIISFPMLALLASYISLLGQPYIDILLAIAILIGLILIIRLAPVDSPSAPIISPYRRKKLKFLSLIALILVAIVIIVFRQSTWVYAPQIQVCLILSILWVSFMLSKLGHHAMFFIDKISITKRKEV